MSRRPPSSRARLSSSAIASSSVRRRAWTPLLTEAAKGRRAVAGLDGALDAINRGAVRRFYVAKSFKSSGHACAGCGALARGDGPQCRLCDSPTTRVDLAHAMSDRVLAAGGRVDVIDGHTGLARVGGVAALLRYPL